MFKAIGLVVLLIAIRIMMPGLFMSFDETGTKFFRAIGRTMDLVDPANFKMQSAGVNYIPKPTFTKNSFQ